MCILAELANWIAFNGKLRFSTDKDEIEKYQINKSNPLLVPVIARVYQKDGSIVVDTGNLIEELMKNHEVVTYFSLPHEIIVKNIEELSLRDET